MADLWSVLVGGVLAVGGGAATQWYLHTEKIKDDRRKLREQKLEEMIGLIYAHRHWMDELKAIRVLGAEREEPISPFAKIYAIAAIYFPDTLVATTTLNVKSEIYKGWMLKKARARLEKNLDTLSEGFNEVYVPYVEASSQLIDELRDIAKTF